MKNKILILLFVLFALSFTFACGENNKEDNDDNKQNETLNEYTVTFVVDGEKTEVKVKEGEKASKPSDPVKEGYEFTGWYVGEEAYNFESGVTSNLEITAKFEEVSKEYTVKFVVSGEETVIKVAAGEKASKPSDPVKDGFVFLGWFIGDEAYDFNLPINADLVITAIFSEACDIIINEEYLKVSNGYKLKIECLGFESSELEYTFSNDGVVEIKNGRIYGLTCGETIVSVSYKEISKTFKAYVFPEIENKMTKETALELNNLFDYEVIDADILKIQDGKLYAINSGTGKIKVVSKDSKVSKEYTISVTGDAPIIVCDKNIVCVGEDVYFDCENYLKEELVWTISNKDVMDSFEDYCLSALMKGVCELTASTSDGLLQTTVVFIVLDDLPKFAIQKEYVVVDTELEINITTDYSIDEVILEFDSECFENISTDILILKALKEGTYDITLKLKEYPEVSFTDKVTVYSKKPLFNKEDFSITVGAKNKLSVVNYLDGYTIEIANPEIIKYEEGLVVGLKPGSSEFKVYLDNEKSLYSVITVEVLPVMPELSAVMPNILVGGSTGFVIVNIDDLEENEYSDYSLAVDDEGVAVIDENGILTGKKAGTVNVSVINKNNNRVKGTTTVKVFESEDKIDNDSIVVTIESPDGRLQAGEMFPTTIFGDYDIEKYNMSTSNDLVLMVNSKGNILAVNAGVAKVNVYLKSNPQIKTSLTVIIEGIANTNYIGRLLQIAEGELGYVEGPNNDTKYGDWYGLPNEEWCAMFVSWCAKESGISTDIIPKYAGCTAGMNWFKERNLWEDGGGNYKPKPGDIIFFTGDTENRSSHTGIVIAYENGTVYTIEGNTSNMCAKRNYSVYSSKIRGYGTPNYPYYDGNIGSGDTGGSTGGEGESTT